MICIDKVALQTIKNKFREKQIMSQVIEGRGPTQSRMNSNPLITNK
jgi:hypothetical protein